MVSKIDKNAMRLKRHVRVRGKISGTPERPRLNVFRSNANIYAQIIDDVNGVTLASANTLEKEFEGLTGNCEGAKKVGAEEEIKWLTIRLRTMKLPSSLRRSFT